MRTFLSNSLSLALLLLIGAPVTAQTAQAPPPEVLRRTPPPSGADGVPRDGAGGYTLPDGTRVVPARDPFAAGAQGVPQGAAGQGAQAAAPAQPAPQPVVLPSQRFDVGLGSSGPQKDPLVVQRDPSQAPAQPQASGSTDAQRILADQQDLADQIRDLRSQIHVVAPGQRSDGLDVDPEGALIMSQIDPRTGKPRRRASQIAREAGLVMIPAGTMLTIRNLTRVQTQLGGTCIAIVEYDVLDAQMDAIAIPRGSRILGAIQTVSGDAQTRAAIIFRQLVDPNGDQTQIMVPESATNSIGMAGIGPDDGATVNRHLGQKFGYALAWGLLGGLTGNNTPSGVNPQGTFQDTIRQNVASSFGQVGQSYLNSAMNIKSDIEVPENTSMRVILGNPIYIKAWRELRPF